MQKERLMEKPNSLSVLEPRDKVAILGLGATSSVWCALAHDPMRQGAEVWTLNAGLVTFQHDLGFDMHSDAYIEKMGIQERVAARREWLKTHSKPVLMSAQDDRYPTSVAYPIEEVLSKTGVRAFDGTLSYMLALALVRDVKTLLMFGVDFSDTEVGKLGTIYWLGRLQARGVTVVLPSPSELSDILYREQLYGQ